MSSVHIDLRKIIGKGAFGQVYLAEVEVSKMSAMYKQMHCNNSLKEYRQRKNLIQVAVKILKGNFDLSKI